jgi:flagellin-specific chaperone FliS|tara:strand:- start:5704 stop:5889 length:186 start_codon:yes stop_codon:yes gene_type:complete
MIGNLDEQRVRYINHLMEKINNQASEIYEGLIDKDFAQAEVDINQLIAILSNIKSSLKDEV